MIIFKHGKFTKVQSSVLLNGTAISKQFNYFVITKLTASAMRKTNPSLYAINKEVAEQRKLVH